MWTSPVVAGRRGSYGAGVHTVEVNTASTYDELDGLAAVRADVPLDYSTCGDDHLKINSITINEYPVISGGDIIIAASYQPEWDITSGRAVVVARVLGMPITEKRDLCAQPGVECPLSANQTITTVIKEHIPSLLPGITVSVHVELFDQDNEKVTCLETTARIKSGILLADQILFAMDQYLRTRPRARPVLRGGGYRRQ